MREALVVARSDYSEVIGLLRGVRKKIRYFETRLAVFLEVSFRTKNDQVFKFAILKIFIAETGGGMLSVQFGKQRLGIEGVHLAWTALHEQRDHTLCRGRKGRRFGREAGSTRGRCLMEKI